jgi:hypothetical protein
LQQLLTAGFRFGWRQTPAALEQRHLGGQMAAFPNLDAIQAGKELHKIRAAIAARAGEPEGVGHAVVTSPLQFVNALWRIWLANA